jgi:hypothetical protein
VGVEGPVINYGGSVVNDTRTGKALYTASLKPEDVLEVFALSHELGVHAQLYQGDTVVYEKDNEYARRYMAFLSLPSVIDPQLMQKRWENVPKVIYITDRERAEELIPKLQKRFEGRLKVSGSKAGFVEFNDPGAHKGSALAWVADYLGIVRDEDAARALAAAMPGNTVYASSKVAIARDVRRRVVEWGGRGVRINAVAPGPFRSPLLQQGLDDPTFVPVVEERDLVSHLVWSASSRLVESVWVDGEQLVAGGRALRIDEERARHEVERRARRLAAA